MALIEFLNTALQLLFVEIRPEYITEYEFAVSALPQQKITEPQFSSGADDQIRIGRLSGGQMPLQILLPKIIDLRAGCFGLRIQLLYRIQNFFSSSVSVFC